MPYFSKQLSLKFGKSHQIHAGYFRGNTVAIKCFIYFCISQDEYKDFLYQRSPGKYEKVDPGDLTAQKAIREKLQCKSFDWFIKEVAPDLVLKYPPVDPPDFASGAIQSVANPTYCIDTLSSGEKARIGMYICALDRTNPQLTQFFALSWQRDIRMKYGDMCWDVSEAGDAPILMFGCHGMQGNQLWKYDHRLQHVIHMHSNRCLEGNFEEKTVQVTKCLRSNQNQKWKFAITNTTALDDWENSGSKLIS